MPSDSDGSLRLVGRSLGHYRILGVLGEGGMGVVYRAFDERLRRGVALKVLPDDAVRDEARRRRFLREARSAAAVSHGNVAAVHDVGEVEGHVYIAMELVEGVTLHDELARGRLPLPEALRIGRAIARALARAHEKGIVHRDLKPENVMIDEEREVKVLDFGLAKLLESEPSSKSLLELDETAASATLEGRVIGTPAYMSPEQAMGMALDARTDVFSFGIVLYEMLTGLRPFHGASPMAIMVAVTRDEAPPLASLVPSLPLGLEQLVDTCLKKEPGKRYPNGRALLAALEAIDASRPSASMPTVPSSADGSAPFKSIETVTKESMRVPRPRSRWPIIAVAVAAVSVAVVGLVAARGFRGESRATAESAAPTVAATTPAHLPEAVSLFAQSARNDRQGRHDLACGDATKASDLDPGFGEAHLFAALCRRGVPRSGRPYFRRAWTMRDALSPGDAALLDGLEPIFQRDPEDDAEEVRRLRDAAARFPTDARIHFVLARALRHVGDNAEANVEMARSLALDPMQPFALELHSDYLAYDGQFERAEEAIDKCLDMAPSSLGCLLERVWIEGEHGECAKVEANARRMLTIEPEDADAQRALANALYAQGRSLGAARELLRRIAEAGEGAVQDPESARDPMVRLDAIHLGILAGDFAQAERLALAMRADATKSQIATEHAGPAILLVQLDREMHRDADAATIAAEYLDGRDAWEPEARFEDWAMANEPTPLMLAVRGRMNQVSSVVWASERADAVHRWQARVEGGARPFVWVYAYAVPAETPAEAIAALAAKPAFPPLPAYAPLSLVGEAIGRTYLLAGRADEALPVLERTAKSCFALDHPLEHTRAHLWLGLAREANGDKPGACEAYSVVKERWGSAKPRPVTMEKAAARMAALGCAK